MTELERAIGSDEVLENNVEGAKFRRKVDTSRLLDYDAMTDRPDMHLVEIDDSVEHTVDSKTRKDIVRNAIENAAEIGSTNSSGGVSVYVNDIGRNILLSTHGLQHGLDRRLKKNAAVTLQAGKLLQNAILINELTPKQNQAAESYVLLGAGKANENIYIVEFVVNQYNNEVASIDVLYSLNTKKEPAVLNAPAIAEKPLRITDSNISIAQLLHLASRYFPDILPESVLRHYGYDRRPDGILGESALFSREVESVESLREQN